MFKVTKEIDFCAAHRLFQYKGLCSNIHGHNYKVQVTFSGNHLNDQGMLIDFKDVKNMVKNWIDIHWDHSLLLFKEDPLLDTLTGENLRICSCSWNPTAENMAEHLLKAIRKYYDNIIFSVKLWETPTSFVEVTNA